MCSLFEFFYYFNVHSNQLMFLVTIFLINIFYSSWHWFMVPLNLKRFPCREIITKVSTQPSFL